MYTVFLIFFFQSISLDEKKKANYKAIYDGRPCVPPPFHSIEKNLLENILYIPKWFLASFHSNSVIVVPTTVYVYRCQQPTNQRSYYKYSKENERESRNEKMTQQVDWERISKNQLWLSTFEIEKIDGCHKFQRA